jgi:hypothetical protein
LRKIASTLIEWIDRLITAQVQLLGLAINHIFSYLHRSLEFMGKQVRFYALPKDEMMFLEFVRSIPETYRVSSKSPNSSIVSFNLPWSTESPEPVFRQYYLGKGNIKTLKPFIRKGSKIVYSEEKMDYVETGEQFFWIDMNAPLIEFSSSFFRDDERLAQGRIWADFYRLEKNEFVHKGDTFETFYETLAIWIRKNFKRVKGIDGYFGKDALAWYEVGGNIFQ